MDVDVGDGKIEISEDETVQPEEKENVLSGLESLVKSKSEPPKIEAKVKVKAKAKKKKMGLEGCMSLASMQKRYKEALRDSRAISMIKEKENSSQFKEKAVELLP